MSGILILGPALLVLAAVALLYLLDSRHIDGRRSSDRGRAW